MSRKEIEKELGAIDSEGLSLTLDSLDFSPLNLSPEELETRIKEIVYRYNEANSLPEYKHEQFYCRWYNSNKIFQAILKLYNIKGAN